MPHQKREVMVGGGKLTRAILSELPSGAALHACPYSDPNDMLRSLRVHWGRTSVAGLTDHAEQVRRVGSQFLIERNPRGNCSPPRFAPPREGYRSPLADASQQQKGPIADRSSIRYRLPAQFFLEGRKNDTAAVDVHDLRAE